MSIAKEYFWLRLRNDFFKSKEMKKLRRIAGGEIYTIIYLKMQLLSLKNNGKVFFDGLESTFEEEIALEIDENLDNVKIAISFLKHAQLLEIVSENELSMPEAINNMGRITSDGIRKREQRLRKKINEDCIEHVHEVGQCPTLVPPLSQKRPPEIELELELELDGDKTEVLSLVGQDPTVNKIFSKKNAKAELKKSAERVLDFLNQKCKTRFLPVNSTIDMISARLKEGISEQDLRCIVAMKFREWANDEQMFKYLRPQTLFNKAKCHSYYGQLNHDET